MLEYYALPHVRRHPTRANPSDAGIDLPFNPIDFQAVTIQPGESRILGTGLKFGVSHGLMLQIMNRSSVAAKRQLIVGACVVDAGYDGEVFVNITTSVVRHKLLNRETRLHKAYSFLSSTLDSFRLLTTSFILGAALLFRIVVTARSAARDDDV